MNSGRASLDKKQVLSRRQGMKRYAWLFLFLFLLLTGMGGRGDVLKYDDGKKDDKQSYGSGGHAIRFERPSDEFVITEIHLYGEPYGNFDPFLEVAKLYICDQSLEPIITTDLPLEAFRRGRARWAEVDVKPVKPTETFYVLVDFLATATRGIYLGIDSGSLGHSFHAVPGKIKDELSRGDWMIRVKGSKKAKPEPIIVLDQDTEKELSYDDGEMDNRKSMAMSGHAVEFTAPRGEWYIGYVSIHGSMYGGKFDPDRTFFNVFVCDKRMRVLSRSAHPYSLFPYGMKPQWVSIEVPPVRVKGKFYVLACFNPTATKGIYVSIDESVKKTHSLIAMPEKPGGKIGSKKEWMIRASIFKKEEVSKEKAADKAKKKTSKKEEPQEGVDAMQVAGWRDEIEVLEAKEDLKATEDLLDSIARISKEDRASFGKVLVTDHVWVSYVNVPDAYARAVADLYECCHAILKDQFGMEAGFCVVPGRRLHVHILAEKEQSLKLWTSPANEEFPLVTNTMPTWERGLSPPEEGGPHVVYGYCHELGHVLMGWKDSRHQWAHYLGSVLVDEVADKLGDSVWPKPYDYYAEGMARFKKAIQGKTPGRDTDEGAARIYYEVEKIFGRKIWGKALHWIRENREGETFNAIRLYCLDDLKEALLDLGCDSAAVERIFGT
jgi:hypothetical protein